MQVTTAAQPSNTSSPSTPSSSTISSPWFNSDTSDTDTENTSPDSDTEDVDEQAWCDAKSFVSTAPADRIARQQSSTTRRHHHPRSHSWSSIDSSTSSSYASSETSCDGLVLLGKEAGDLLAQLESAVCHTPPRRFNPTPAREFAFDDRYSPVAGPSRRMVHRQQSKQPLTSSSSTATLNANISQKSPRPVSFTKTDLAGLDIDSLITAFDDFAAERKLELAVEGWREEWREEQTPTQRTFESALIKKTNQQLLPASPLRRDSARQLFPSPSPLSSSSSTSVNSTRRRMDTLPYADLFPVTTSSIFPTRKKSSPSLRSSTSCASFAPPVPTAAPIDYPVAFPQVGSTSPFAIRSTPEKPNRASIASTSTGSSPAGSTRSSVFSSDSFRWSVTSGSTAPTIAEGEEEDGCPPSSWSPRGSLSSSSGYSSSGRYFPPRRGSGPAGHSHGRKGSEDIGYEDFLSEVGETVEEEDRSSSASALPFSSSSHPFQQAGFSSRRPSVKGGDASNRSSTYSSSSGGSSVDYPGGSVALAFLNKNKSSPSLRRIRSTASITPPPPIPIRTASLSRKSAKARGKEKATAQ
ncbi:hypothetical protein T439DRAFT_349423 [Meredithblackwellia eburnea MCA 4105]